MSIKAPLLDLTFKNLTTEVSVTVTVLGVGYVTVVSSIVFSHLKSLQRAHRSFHVNKINKFRD